MFRIDDFNGFHHILLYSCWVLHNRAGIFLSGEPGHSLLGQRPKFGSPGLHSAARSQFSVAGEPGDNK